MNIAYVRVSTVDQNPERQKEQLSQHNIEKWFEEKVSGKDTNRVELQAMLGYMREGDKVFVSDFSRLSRSVSDLLQITEMMQTKGVQLISIKENIDTGTSTGKLMLTMIGAIAEFERMNILERQKEGIAIAKREGKYKGRKPKTHENFDEVYEKWKNKEITAACASEMLGVSRGTFYNLVKNNHRIDNKLISQK